MSTYRFQARYDSAEQTTAGYVPVRGIASDERHVRTAGGARGLATRWHRRTAVDRTVVEIGVDAAGWTYTVLRAERGPARGALSISRTRLTDGYGDVVDYVHPIPAPEPLPEIDLSRFPVLPEGDEHGEDCKACAAGEGSIHAYEAPDDDDELVMVSDQDYDAFRSGYRAAMLWANVIDSDAPDLDVDDDDPRLEDAEVDMVDADAFLRDNLDDLHSAGDADMSQHGHDFALTRNRHGAGFWDRGYGDVGDRLTEAAHVYGEDWIDLASDDDKLARGTVLASGTADADDDDHDVMSHEFLIEAREFGRVALGLSHVDVGQVTYVEFDTRAQAEAHLSSTFRVVVFADGEL